MIFKSLPPRITNILTHTHTVAGISISFVLFIIFLCGAFALFRYEMYRWENQEARIPTPTEINLEAAITTVKAVNPLFDPGSQFNISLPREDFPFITFFGAQFSDDTKVDTERFFYYLNPVDNYKVVEIDNQKTTLGNTLYHLHYLEQVPFGIHLSGIVSLFFLFASITGIIIHWKNVSNKFYAFITEGKWKLIWKNAHTVLGVIGLPFQIIYAITGALFGLLTLLLIPSALVLFGGDTSEVLATVRPANAIEVDSAAQVVNLPPLDQYLERTQAQYSDYHVLAVRCKNYGKEDAIAIFNLDDKVTINGIGEVVYRMSSGEILLETKPQEKGYTQSVLSTVIKLHFATFGGFGLKVLYFLLAIITCFMLIAGVVLWYEARNNNLYTEKQRKFHFRVTKWYLAICLSLFPAIALLFIANKLVPLSLEGRISYVNAIFFVGWLILTLVGTRWNNFRLMNRNFLLLGAGLGFLVPIANGFLTADWIWHTAITGQWYVFGVDAFWILYGATALFAAVKLKSNDEVAPETAEVQKETKVKEQRRILA